MEFIFFVSILQRCKLAIPEGEPERSFKTKQYQSPLSIFGKNNVTDLNFSNKRRDFKHIDKKTNNLSQIPTTYNY